MVSYSALFTPSVKRQGIPRAFYIYSAVYLFSRVDTVSQCEVSDETRHANKAASMALYFTTLRDKEEEGKAWLCLPNTLISLDTGIAKPSTKALLAQSHGLNSTEH